MYIGTTDKHVHKRHQLLDLGKRQQIQPDGDTLEKLRCCSILQALRRHDVTASARKQAGINARLKANRN